MSLPPQDAAALSKTWTEGVLLKRDVFSTVERGRYRTSSGEVDAVLRRLDQVPWWSYLLALHLFTRERRALTLARDLRVGPELLWAGDRALVRGFIDGVALHLAKPHHDARYFKSAKLALRKLHRMGVCHNDLAKEQNWLRGSDGLAYVTDFQLAVCFKSRSQLFRIAAYEDLRHLLKHKRTYAPELLTPKEKAILSKKSLPARIWLMTGKKVYRAITRGIFNFTDREGGGKRLVNDAPPLLEIIKQNPAVRDASIVAFADRRTGVGLYAFVEADDVALETKLQGELAAAKGCEAAGASAGRRSPAPRRLRPHSHRSAAARRHEPGRSAGAIDDQRRRPRIPEGHSGVAEEPARPFQLRDDRPEADVTLSARRATASTGSAAAISTMELERIVIRSGHLRQIVLHQRHGQERRTRSRRHIGEHSLRCRELLLRA